jgi:hypothetical protein
VLRDEIAARRLRADALQNSSRAFLEHSLPAYLLDMAELNTDVFADMLRVADESLEHLAGALIVAARRT